LSKAVKYYFSCCFSWTKTKTLGHISPVKNQKIKVGVIGARGYTGAELSRILLSHPYVEYKYYFYSPDRSFNFEDLGFNAKIYNSLPKPLSTEVLDDSQFLLGSELDVVFLATPNEVSLELVPKLMKSSVSIIDLSGVYRLDYSDKQKSISQYLKYYKLEHTNTENLSQFMYGLVPFNINKFNSPKGKYYISNPGCYVTSVLMALKPLLLEGLVEAHGIVIDAKSGTSGAGKKAAENLLFSEVYNECLPYKMTSHQHKPEIEMYLNQGLAEKVEFVFTPHLLPIHRGIISSIYTKWASAHKNKADYEKNELIKEAYLKHYSTYPLIKWAWVKESKSILNMKHVVQSPLTQIGFDFDETHLYVFSQIDNLLKGAASQAIENLNLIYKLKPETGLTQFTESL
jgi:N-acetyl-gamma-glutamyl-phosphate reductase